MLLKDGAVQVHVGLVQPDPKLKAHMAREALLLLLYFAHTQLRASAAEQIGSTATLPQMDPQDVREELWSRRLSFSPIPGRTSLRLDLEDRGVRQALEQTCRTFIARRYVDPELVWEPGVIPDDAPPPDNKYVDICPDEEDDEADE